MLVFHACGFFLFPLLLLCWEEGMRGAMWVLMEIVIKPDPSVSKILELSRRNLTRVRLNQRDQLSSLSVM